MSHGQDGQDGQDGQFHFDYAPTRLNQKNWQGVSDWIIGVTGSVIS